MNSQILSKAGLATASDDQQSGHLHVVDDLMIVGMVNTWHQVDESNAQVISYTFCLLHQGKTWKEAIYPPAGHRLTLEEFLEKAKSAAIKNGVVNSWPERFVLAARWTASQLRCFEDWDQIKSQFPRQKSSFITRTHPVRVGSRGQFRLDLRDVIGLAPNNHDGIEELAVHLQIRRPPVPQLYQNDKRAWRRRDPLGFQQWVTADAEVVARYVHFVADLFKDLPRSARACPVPATIGSVAIRALKDGWNAVGVDYRRVCGTRRFSRPSWSSRARKPTRQIEDLPTPLLRINETLAIEANHGARNEVYSFGPSQEDDWCDYDFNSAYPTILASIGMPQWDQLRITTDPKDFGHDTLGAALLDFEFPKETRFPVIPVRNDSGLIFPRTGKEAYATSPEIWLAISLGARIIIHQGYVIPTVQALRPFESYMRSMLGTRGTFKEKSLEERLYKDMANCLNGKLGQGLGRKVHDTRRGDFVPLRRSEITNPFLACHVTGTMRAVMGETLNLLPVIRQVLMATTDGFLANASREEVTQATSGPLCQILRNSRKRLLGNDSIIKAKGKARMMVTSRRRSAATILPAGQESGVIVVSSGIKVQASSIDEKNRWYVQQFFKRKWETTFEYRRSPSLYEMYHSDLDPIQQVVTERLSLDCSGAG